MPHFQLHATRPRLLAEEIRRQVRVLRERSGLSQADLGSRTEMAQTVISRIETHAKGITLATLCRLAEGLGVALVVRFVDWNQLSRWQEIEAPDPMWRPIETAPRDGSRILLFGRTGEIEVGEWWPEGDSWKDDFSGLVVTGCWQAAGGWFQPDEVSHWMPLPAAPG